ncbi:MAG: AAA family ATPase [Methanobacteriaceae archaeon]|nr:AAA family ATPase [Methanobacteriaceae archaeon]MDP2836402.1 AAA family ATPase [Methanobacteriaceae archaeon]MDP3035419.1 AAA family ATPase [Methanobacteriaceae archaeon]MDP3484449.1 AAA family ATPase [Methanobacteriaceae archaeon]MDP3622625.1 AAA family ATPase [Methanobacteriaceae archaeon]
MARRKSPPSKSAGLGMGLDALIKSKTRDENNEIEENQLKSGSDEIEISEDLDDNKASKSPESKPVKVNSSTKNSVSRPSDSAASNAEKSTKSLISKSTTTNDAAEADSTETQRINLVISDVKKNPRITLWSSRSAAVLRYLKKTQPEFSISKEASKLIEDAVKEKYPEIWDLFDVS